MNEYQVRVVVMKSKEIRNGKRSKNLAQETSSWLALSPSKHTFIRKLMECIKSYMLQEWGWRSFRRYSYESLSDLNGIWPIFALKSYFWPKWFICSLWLTTNCFQKFFLELYFKIFESKTTKFIHLHTTYFH